MLKIVNLFGNFLISKNIVEDDELIVDSSESNSSGQNLSNWKKALNSVKLKKLKNYPKLFKSKKKILNKLEILLNLTMAIYTHTIKYWIAKTRVTFICLKQAFIKVSIFRHFHLKYHIRIKTNVSGYVISGFWVSWLQMAWINST